MFGREVMRGSSKGVMKTYTHLRGGSSTGPEAGRNEIEDDAGIGELEETRAKAKGLSAKDVLEDCKAASRSRALAHQ